MKVLHIMLACFYIDNYNYQENILPRIHKELGHSVKIIASTETFIDNNILGYMEPGEYVNEDGIEVVRLPYKNALLNIVTRKRRKYVGLMQEILNFRPDVIMCHGIQFKDLDVVIEYKKNNPNIKVYADSHEDEFNSASSWISKYMLHKLYYGRIIKKNYKRIDKIFCVSKSSIDFMHDMYNIPYSLLEFLPLGGIIDNDTVYSRKRIKYRQEFNLKDDDIVFCHSGKMTKEKKTKELVETFCSTKYKKFKLLLIGNIIDNSDFILKYIEQDDRIQFLGWRNGKELNEILAASDVYVQPGTQSATMQTAACMRNCMMLCPYENHKYIFKTHALYISDQNDMEAVFNNIGEGKINLEKLREASYEIAREKLDYYKIAKRVLK